MASKTNLATDVVSRLYNDETAELTTVFTRNGSTPDDLSDRTFSYSFCTKDTMTEVLSLPNERLVRPEGVAQPDRFTVVFTDADRTALGKDVAYTVYLREGSVSHRKPLVYYTFTFISKPDTFVAGSPREAAYLQVDFTTATGTVTALPVYQLQGIPLLYAATRNDALGQPFVGRVAFVLVTVDEYYTEADVLYMRTQNKFRRLATFD